MADGTALGVIIAGSMLPSLLLTIWLRNREQTRPEPWRAIGQAFLYGATVGAFVALVVNTLFGVATTMYGVSASFMGAVVVAPFVEEAAKAMGLGTIRRRIMELEDGIVYGAAIGLGFAATENILYGVSAAFSDGGLAAVQVVAMRSFSSTVLHAGTTALLGFGYGHVVLRGGVPLQLIPVYLLSVAIHAAYNALVLWQTLVGFVLAILLVWGLLVALARRIRVLDALPHLSPLAR